MKKKWNTCITHFHSLWLVDFSQYAVKRRIHVCSKSIKSNRNKENRQTKKASDCNLFNWPAKPMICRCHFLINGKHSNLIAAQFILITAHCCWLCAGKAGVSVGIYPRVIFFNSYLTVQKYQFLDYYYHSCQREWSSAVSHFYFYFWTT